MKYAQRRDANERAIIAAMEAVGAAVQQLSPPLPDLLVSFRGVLHLIEVKDHRDGIVTRAPNRRNDERGMPPSLTPSQVNWWRSWKGKAPVIVHSIDEALDAIGFRAVEQGRRQA